MKLLITGAGTVGSALSRQLVADGHDVTLLDLTPPSELGAAAYLPGDLRDAAATRDAVEGVDGVFHTAALHMPPPGRTFTSRDYLDVNVIGTYNVLEAAAATGVRRVVHCSTLGVTDVINARTDEPGVHAVTLDDAAIDATRSPTDIYTFTKALDEYTLEYFHATAALDVVALRYGAIWEFVRDHFSDRLPELISANAITRLDDVVRSLVAAMLHPERLPRLTYTVVARPLVSAEQLQAAGGDLRSAVTAAGRPDLAVHVPAPSPSPRLFFDTSDSERDLGFTIACHAQDLLSEVMTNA